MICLAIEYFLDFARLFIYAFLMAGTFNVSEELRESQSIISNGGFAYLGASLILISIGTIYLISFLRYLIKVKETGNYKRPE